MLCLLGVTLSVLCLVSPAPLGACPASSLFMETIEDLQKLRSKGSSEITPLADNQNRLASRARWRQNNTLEEGGNAATYLEGFIEALKKSKESAEQESIVQKLQKIQDYGESCTGWKSALKEHHWKAVEKYDFFSNLEYLLRFLGHNALPEETN